MNERHAEHLYLELSGLAHVVGYERKMVHATLDGGDARGAGVPQSRICDADLLVQFIATRRRVDVNRVTALPARPERGAS